MECNWWRGAALILCSLAAVSVEIPYNQVPPTSNSEYNVYFGGLKELPRMETAHCKTN